MKTGIVVLLAVLCAAAGLLAGSTLLRRPGAPASVSEDVERENRELRHRLEVLRTERIEREHGTAAVETEASRAEAELADTRAELREPDVAPSATPADSAAEVEVTAAPRFFADAYGGALRDVDWNVVGNSMSQLSALIPRIATKLAAGEGPGHEDMGRVQELNGPLIRAVGKVHDRLPGSFTNGKFTDPSFMINAMSTTLAMAKQPLTESQARALEATAETWMARDRQRREAYDDRTWQVRRIREEAELKVKFLAEAFGHLTSTQVETLSPAHVRDRVRLDLFSASLLFTSLARPDFFATREALVASTVDGIGGTLKVTDEERERIRPLIADWVERLPRALTEHETDALDLHGLLHVSLVITAAREQERLVKALAEELAIADERLEGMKQYALVHVPIPRPEKDAD